MTSGRDHEARAHLLARVARERILLLDGAMGTEIQKRHFDEAAFRGMRFAAHGRDLRGNNDLLNLTQPAAIREIHDTYLAAGADILKANTFNANAIAQADYDLSPLAREIAAAGARLAHEAVHAAEAADGRPRFAAGVLGPTNKTMSISPRVTDPGYRDITFDGLAAAYADCARGLVEGGADILMIETVFDTLNAKAAIFAVERVFDEAGFRLPLMISGTITDLSGRTLSGQTVEAFFTSVRHARPFSVGLNCALGAAEMRAFLTDLARVADTRVSVHPNAGLPNAFGGYDETPETTAHHLGEWAKAGMVNIVGGCCGTTPEHIATVAAQIRGLAPRDVPAKPHRLRLSGLEAFELAR
ncbi:MAG: homocysteine S-methyltransferase family protein [Rhodospirillaceae bacterium]|nr:homocysteine S-methyltransferase family protein [Rhodospirillaceae bacterium]